MAEIRQTLEPGRHAGPVDQAEGILWAADLRLRAVQLVDSAQHARHHADQADAQDLEADVDGGPWARITDVYEL